MTTWICLLRGINVGGRNRLAMADLRALLAGLGLENVETVIQSGNAVFRSRARSARRLSGRIRAAIEEHSGFAPHVLLLRPDELDAALGRCPFRADDPSRLHLFFCDEEPRSADTAAMERARSGREQFALEGGVLYLHAPDGIGRSKLAAGVERWLGVSATARNQRTLRRLRDLAEED